MSESDQNNERGLQEHYAFIRHAWVTQEGSYGLEEHLKSFRDTDGYEGLYASWGCDKVKFREVLKGTGANNPHFSEHGEAHSKQIIACIELLLGEKRIHQLSASDTWLLLQCAYTHDFGMAMSAKEMVERFAKEGSGFPDKLQRQFEETNNKDALEALHFIKPILNYACKKPDDEGGSSSGYEDMPRSVRMDDEKKWEVFNSSTLLWPSDFIEKFTTVQENWFRSPHAENSRQILSAKAYNDNKEEVIIPLRLRLMIARIAQLHSSDNKNILDLPQEDLGVCNDHIHPRFTAILLRLGDLLDMDNGRFSRVQLLRIGGENEGSIIHLFKHEAITHFLITPLEVSVRANFDRVYAEQLIKEFNIADIDKNRLCMKACQELFRWLNWLEADLNFFARNWLEIIPRKLEGGCPTFRKPEICINNKTVNQDELQLKYKISTKRSTEIIEGSGLYQVPKKVFLRELLQNALDATKLQLHRDVISGRFEEFAASDWSLDEDAIKALTPYCYMEKLIFALNQYRIEYSIQIIDNNSEIPILQFLLRDYGIGINEDALQGMLHIGDIQTPKQNLEIEQMPVWLKPTRGFGIGLQSVFYLVKSFKIRSRARYETNHPFPPLRVMQFYSNRFGGEIDVQTRGKDESERFGFGTEVCVEIPLKTMQNQLDVYHDNGFDIFDETLMHMYNYFIKAMEQITAPQALFPILKRMPRQASICKFPDDVLSPMQQNKPENFLQRVFGDFCILLLKDKPPLIKPEQQQGKRLDFFSCWSDKYQLLMIYHRIDSPENTLHSLDYGKIRLFYKGIEVNEEGANLRQAVHIPFWEVEIHLYADFAKKWLEINRDHVPEERIEILADMIHETHLSLLKFLFSKEINSDDTLEVDKAKENQLQKKEAGLFSNAVNSIWIPKANDDILREYYMLAKTHSAFYVSLLDKYPAVEKFLVSEQSNEYRALNDCIPSYIYSAGSQMLRHIDVKTAQSVSVFESALYYLHKNKNESASKVFFVNNNTLAGMDYKIESTAGDTTFYLLPHLLIDYKEYAAKQFILMRLYQDGHNTSVPCFHLGKRENKMMIALHNDYWDYVVYIIQNCEPDKRPVFPSAEAYENISVSSIPPPLVRDEIKIFDSWIISPLKGEQLRDFLEESRNTPPDKLDILLNRVIPEKWIEQHLILLKYIYNNRISNLKTVRSIKELRKNEKCDIWRSYVLFLKKLQSYMLPDSNKK